MDEIEFIGASIHQATLNDPRNNLSEWQPIETKPDDRDWETI